MLPILLCLRFSFRATATSHCTIPLLAKPSSTFLRTRFFHCLPLALSRPSLSFPSLVYLFTFPSPCPFSSGMLRCKKREGEADEPWDSQGCLAADAAAAPTAAPPSCSAAIAASLGQHPPAALPSDGCTPAIPHFCSLPTTHPPEQGDCNL